MDNVTICIQARLGSTRLPRKALMEVMPGKDILTMMHYRLWSLHATVGKRSPVVLCPDGEEEQLWLGGEVWGGHPTDVLKRFADFARLNPTPWYVRLTGDCPLIDPITVRQAIATAVGGAIGYLDWSNAPDGNDVEVFSYEMLMRADRCATQPGYREHVTTWMRDHWMADPELMCPRVPGIKYSVDTQEDLDRVRRIIKALGPDCTSGQIVAYLKENP